MEVHDTSKPAAIAQIVRENTKPEVHELKETDRFALVPKGMELQSLKKIRNEDDIVPERRNALTTTHDINSFIDHVDRYKSADTTIFASVPVIKESRAHFKMEAVVDYHPPGSDIKKAGAQKHTITFQAEAHRQVVKWLAASEKYMGVEAFSSFIEDNIADLTTDNTFSPPFGKSIATPADMLTLSRGLEVKVNSTVKNATRLSNGETQLVFTTENRDNDGNELVVAEWFFVRIPLFIGGEAVIIPMRLRYRVQGGQVLFAFIPFRFDETLEDAVGDSIEAVAQALPDTHLVKGVASHS